MSFYNLTASHLSRLIHEFTNIALDKSNTNRYGIQVDVLLVRASRYSQKNEQGQEYSQFVVNLLEQSLTELAFLSQEEARGILNRLEAIQQKHDKAFEVIDQNKQLFLDRQFVLKKFEQDFNHLFNLPEHSSEFDDSQCTINLFYDLFDAVGCKEWALYLLKKGLTQQYFPDEPIGDRKKPKIYPPDEVFKKEATKQLVIDGLRSFAKERYDDLEKVVKLVNGDKVDDPILLTCSQAELCRILKEVRMVDLTAKPNEVTKWVCLNFRRIPKSIDDTDLFNEKTILRNIGVTN